MKNKAIFYKPSELVFKQQGKKSALIIGNVQSGKTRFMIEQSKSALDKDFDAVIILGGSNNMLLHQSYNRFNNDLRKSGYSVVEVKDNSVKRIENKIIITSLKHKDSIEKLIKILHESFNKKVLIFDDESDFGSINTSKNSKSKIHSLIKKLFDNLEVGYFASVTATPFADLSSKDSFEFDEIVRLKPGLGYKGLVHYNNSKNYISVNDIEGIKEFTNFKEVSKIIINHIWNVYLANKTKSQLLINNGMKNSGHEKTKQTIWECLDIMSKQRMSMWFDQFKTPFDTDKIFKLINEYKQNVFVVNQENKNWNKDFNSIVIGGSLVSRGYTFPDLTTCIMLNVPKGKIPADTLLQRARWFGYRSNFENIKVYMPERLKESYIEMEKLNNVIFNMNLKTKKEIMEKIENLTLEYITPTAKVKNEK